MRAPRAVLLTGALALAALASTTTALAAFPGEEGRIAAVRHGGGVAELVTMEPDGSEARVVPLGDVTQPVTPRAGRPRGR